MKEKPRVASRETGSSSADVKCAVLYGRSNIDVGEMFHLMAMTFMTFMENYAFGGLMHD